MMVGQTEQVVIGRVSPDQWATYREVRLAALADAPEAFSSTLERELGFAEQLWRDRLGSNVSLLAWLEDRPVGTVTVLGTEIADTHGFTGAWHLVAMWVSRSARGLGVGTQLVDAAADAARSGGAPALLLWVVETNDAARSLYERMGFLATGVRQVVEPDHPGRWEQLMMRELA